MGAVVMIPAPFDHQTKANEKLNPLQYAALFADMGTGKSRIAIDWFIHKHNTIGSNHVVIIGPIVVLQQWLNEQLPTHCSVHYNAYVYNSKPSIKHTQQLDNFMMSAKYSKGLHIFLINFDSFASKKGATLVEQFLSTHTSPPVIIIDESSRIKSPDALSVKSIVKLRKTYPESFRLIMSGTPASKSPVDLWSQFDFLTHNYFQCGYVFFRSQHTVRTVKKLQIKGRLMQIESVLDRHTYDKIKLVIDRNTKDGKLHPDVPAMLQAQFHLTAEDFWCIVNSQVFTRFKNTDKIREQIKPITYAVKRSECVDLPEKIYQTITCELNPEQKKLIKDLVQYSAAVYGEDVLTVEVTALIGMRVLQICGGNFSHLTDLEGKYATKPISGSNSKLQYILKDIPEIGEQQFIICAVFTPEIELLQKEISKVAEVGSLYGETSDTQRAKVVQDFKAGYLQGLIMNPTVGGYGLNLQMASVQYWYSRNYRTEARLQTEDRIHRIGTDKSPIYKDLVSNIKFEQDVLDVLREGKEINDVFVNKKINEIFKL